MNNDSGVYGESYSRRARPTIVYGGLAMIFIVYVAYPLFVIVTSFLRGGNIVSPPDLNLPTEFWYSWTAVVGAWVVGRSVEKVRGENGKNGGVVERIVGK